ncbi:hypothetical protein LTR17_009214 [Elasticomyces elasticus]|nr:hypothetical protein LTR17_009214 [Elasticomyces elasticus]
MSFCLGNIIGPLSFTPASAPDYIPAKITIGKFLREHIPSQYANIVTCAFAACVTIVLQFYYIRENKRRDGLVEAGAVGHLKDQEFADMTDRENKEFRYRL